MIFRESIPIKEIVNFEKGRNPKELVKSPQDNSFLPYLEADYYRSGRTSQFANPIGVKIINEGDLIMIFDGSKSGEIIRNDKKGILASTMVKLIYDSSLVDSDFLQYFIQRHFNKLNEETTGAGIPHLNQNIFLNLKLPKINISDQRRIASEIREKLTIVERMRQAALRQKEAVEALQGALLREVFPFKEGDKLPEGWRWERIGYIFEECKILVQPYEEEFKKLPFIGLENIVSHSREYTDEEFTPPESTCFLFNKECVLYGKLRPYLDKVYLPKSVGKSSMELIPLKPKNQYSREFIAGILQSESVIGDTVKFSTGGRMPRANLNKLKNLKVAIPIDIKQCIEIGKRVTGRISKINKLKNKAQIQLEAIEALPAAILREVFEFKS